MVDDLKQSLGYPDAQNPRELGVNLKRIRIDVFQCVQRLRIVNIIKKLTKWGSVQILYHSDLWILS